MNSSKRKGSAGTGVLSCRPEPKRTGLARKGIPKFMSRQPIAYLEQVDASLARGDLIAASLALEAHQAQDSHNPYELIALSQVMRLRGRYPQALNAIERAVEHNPMHVSVLVERARYALGTGDLTATDAWFERAWRDLTQEQMQDADDAWVAEWLDVLMRLSRRERARQVASAWCERKPEDGERWFWLGYTHHVDALQAQALDAYLRCAQLVPRRPMLRNNIAAVYLELEDYSAARPLLEQTLAEEPGNALAWTNLGTLLLKRGEIAQAQVAAERACVLAPDYPTALRSHSYVLKELQQWPEALAAIERAYALGPADGATQWSLAMLQLIHGDYVRGWISHEWRWNGSPELRSRMPNFSAPLWEGQSLAGRTLLIWGEQGHGDALQFVRFVPAIAERVRREGGKLIYCCFPGLLTLFRRSLEGVVETVLPSTVVQLPDFDYHVPLATLPLRLGITVDDLPVWSAPYLSADEAQVNGWRKRCARFRAAGALKVGIVWSGSRTHQRNPMRAVDPVACAKAWGSIPDVEFFSLQVDAADEVSAARRAGLRLEDHTAQFTSFDDTAAYLRNLDLVITVCTSVAHLAGALGVRTWLLLDVNPHWVWMIGRPDSPWYPSLTLYRQPAYGQWDPVLVRVAKDLARLAGQAGLTKGGDAGQ